MPQPIFSARYFIFPLLAVFFALGVYEMMPSLTPATAEEAFDEVADESTEVVTVGQTGMPASNARVRPILVKHRNQFVVVCVAGCKGQASPVQFRPSPCASALVYSFRQHSLVERWLRATTSSVLRVATRRRGRSIVDTRNPEAGWR